MKTRIARLIRDYDEANRICAEIIRHNPTKYPEGSGARQWADAVTARLASGSEPELFRECRDEGEAMQHDQERRFSS